MSNEIAMMVSTVDDRNKCMQIGSDTLDELQKLIHDSIKMKESFESILDICNLKLNNVLEEIWEVEATNETLLQEAQNQNNGSISVRNTEESNITRIKNVFSVRLSMEEALSKKLEKYNSCITCLSDIICKLNLRIVNMDVVIDSFFYHIREQNTNYDMAIQLGNKNLNKMSQLCSEVDQVKESLNKKLELCDRIMYDAKDSLIVSINNVTILMNEFDEINFETEEVRKLMTKINKDIKQQDEIQRIEWAIANIESVVENFQFKVYPLSEINDKTFNKPMESHILLKKILMAFRDGAGIYLPDAIKNEEYPTSDQEETKKQEFRDRISSQIKLLIRSRPTISTKEDGRFSIFHS